MIQYNPYPYAKGNWDRETDRENICENEGKPRNANDSQQIIRNYTKGHETDFLSYLSKETILPTPGSANAATRTARK